MRGKRLFKVSALCCGPGRWRWNVMVSGQSISSGIASSKCDMREKSRAAQAEYLQRNSGRGLSLRTRN
jgi:hypothetical protein